MTNDLYRDRAARIDTMVGGSDYYAMLHKLYDSFANYARKETKHLDQILEFAGWCERVHGFRPIYDDSGGITSVPAVTDPKKYTVCLLKYGG